MPPAGRTGDGPHQRLRRPGGSTSPARHGNTACGGSGASRLVGRQWEIAAVEAILERAIDGDGSVVARIGPAGIGKSRVVREIAATAAGRGADVLGILRIPHQRHPVPRGRPAAACGRRPSKPRRCVCAGPAEGPVGRRRRAGSGLVRRPARYPPSRHRPAQHRPRCGASPTIRIGEGRSSLAPLLRSTSSRTRTGSTG